MKTDRFRIAVVVLGSLMSVASALAQQKPEYDMGTMQMVFLSQTPEFRTPDLAGIRKEHRVYIESLINNEKLALWGEMAGEGDLREIVVVKNETLGEAQQMAQSFPAVKVGMLRADVLSWYAARNLIKPAKGR